MNRCRIKAGVPKLRTLLDLFICQSPHRPTMRNPVSVQCLRIGYNSCAALRRSADLKSSFATTAVVISTGAVLSSMAADNPEVCVVQFDKNQGAGAALTAAIAATRLDWVLLVDSDGQFPIENLRPLLAGLRGVRALAAIGIRQKKDTLFARFGTWASGVVCNLLYGTRILDFNSACKLVWGPLLRSLRLEARGMNYSTEVTARLLECGVSIVEVAIEHRPRTSGTSSMRLIRGSLHRLLFVCYLAMRGLLFRIGVLQVHKFD